MLVRPSYVLGGRAMEIVYNMKELKNYMENAVEASSEKPVLIDRYIGARWKSMLFVTVNKCLYPE